MSLRRFLFSFPIFFTVFLLQEAVVTQMRLPAGGINLLLVVALIWAALSTPEIGALTGFGAGLMMDVSQTSPGPMGHWTLVLIIACYAIAFLGYGDDNIRGNPINIILLVTVCVVAAQLVFLFLGMMLGQEVGSVSNIAFLLAGSAFWTAIISPLILKVVSFFHAIIFGARAHL
jgi:rod shape-determining protein MreD